MSRYRRWWSEGATYFFTVNLAVRSSRLLVDRIDLLRACYRKVAENHPFETIAICILPDHIHAIWKMPEDDADFATRWRLIKSGFAHGILPTDDPGPRRRTGERGVWQRRYWEHRIRDEEDFGNHVAYVYRNPVKHGHVADIDDWPYSSWHRDKAQWRHWIDRFNREIDAGEL